MVEVVAFDLTGPEVLTGRDTSRKSKNVQCRRKANRVRISTP
jgi:hypothetical protein